MFKQKREKSFHWLLWFVFYTFLFLLLLNNSYRYLDPDLGWHLRVGEAIAIDGGVPRANLYNYTLGDNWVDHEWLADFLLFKTYSSSGYLAVSIGFSCLVLAVIILLHYQIKREFPQVSPFAVMFFQIFGLVAALPSLGVRLQILGLVFVVVVLSIILAYERKSDWRLLAILPPLFYLWSLLHASFLLGLFLLFAWIFIRWLENFFDKLNVNWLSSIISYRPSFSMKMPALVAVISVISTCLTPYRLELYSFLVGYRDNFYQMHIKEWLPQHVFPLQYTQLLYMALVASIMILHTYRSYSKKIKLDLWAMFLILIFLFLSWQSRRHFPLLVVATMPFITFYSYSLFNDDVKDNNKKVPAWLQVFIMSCLVLASASLLVQLRVTNQPFSSFCQDYPCQAVDFLASRDDLNNYNLFNDYGWGGYLIWTLPDRKLFIDGRLPQKEFANHTFLEEYYEFFSADSDIGSKLNEYDINLVLIPAQDHPLVISRWEKILFSIKDNEAEPKNYLRLYLEEENWPIIYSDNVAVIYAHPLIGVAN